MAEKPPTQEDLEKAREEQQAAEQDKDATARGIARGLENRCLILADERGDGGSTQSSSVWPPRFTCELAAVDGTSGTVEVGQPGVALLRAGWVLGFPVLWVALGAGIRLRQNSREEFPPSR